MKTPRSGSGTLLAVGLLLALVGLASAAQDPSQPTSPTSVLPAPGFGTADSNDTMIAVTGVDVTGASILFVIDSERRQLAVYQANGGTSSTMGVKLVGARKIDLDLKLDGYKDKSDYTYKELAKEFAQHNPSPPADQR